MQAALAFSRCDSGGLRAGTIAAGYAAAGAAAISVLTEPAFFDGALDHLRAVRGCVDIPLLQKDFIVSEYQLIEGRAAGADAALLIAAGIDDAMLPAFRGGIRARARRARGSPRSDRARPGARGRGGRSRSQQPQPATLAVDLEASRTLVEAVPEGTVAVAESGLRTPADLQQLRGAGYDAFLMGESLMSQPEPGAALARLLAGVESVPRGARERPLRPETQTR